MNIPLHDYDQYFDEEHLPHSNALHSILKDQGEYFVGPLARYSLNFDKLPAAVQEVALAAGLSKACTNPFKGIIVRAVETVYACEEAIRIIDQYVMPDKPAIPIEPIAGIGYGCTEAPRGILYHRYKVDQKGIILGAKIVPPTAQNQKVIESDLRKFVSENLHLSDDKLTWQCEQTIRNYDPCISCATHFLRLDIVRE